MGLDIDRGLRDWEFKPGVIQARLVEGLGGRQIMQIRVDLGILQLELIGRPDGQKPHGFPSYYEYLKHQAALSRRSDQTFTLTEEQCVEVDREFFQFYQRRIGYLTLRNFERAVRDADHSVNLMDLVKAYSPSEEYTLAHEQYRPFIIYHRSLAAADAALEKNQPEHAIDAVQAGLERIRMFFEEHELEEKFEDDVMVSELKQKQDHIREEHGVDATLQEQLRTAVEQEQYEVAAKLRDAIRKQQG